jgi:hypothetical protein
VDREQKSLKLQSDFWVFLPQISSVVILFWTHISFAVILQYTTSGRTPVPFNRQLCVSPICWAVQPAVVNIIHFFPHIILAPVTLFGRSLSIHVPIHGLRLIWICHCLETYWPEETTGRKVTLKSTWPQYDSTRLPTSAYNTRTTR